MAYQPVRPNKRIKGRKMAAYSRRKMPQKLEADVLPDWLAYLHAHAEWLRMMAYSESTVTTGHRALVDFVRWCALRAIDGPQHLTVKVLEQYALHPGDARARVIGDDADLHDGVGGERPRPPGASAALGLQPCGLTRRARSRASRPPPRGSPMCAAARRNQQQRKGAVWHAVQAENPSCTACPSVENRWPSRPSPGGRCAALTGLAWLDCMCSGFRRVCRLPSVVGLRPPSATAA
ncbi:MULTISPECIES: hypothetical protein [unclassified Caballeronia]|uniref:hypothetical protein n=1 Tax=unclassified Caballeronia TaxID=2646786 RepID=UPI00202836B4|nr:MULTISPECIES: hypothetical protein [unclassified Caballeronia]MDR5767867.1 hypothetical protein [Caballeronia sp. LZ028]